MRPKKSAFLRWRDSYFVSLEKAADFLGVTLRTVRSWDTSGAPDWAMRLIAISTGDLSGIHPAWRGWKISHTGKLHGPGRLTFTAEHLSHVPAMIQRLDELEGSIHAQAREQALVFERLKRDALERLALELSQSLLLGTDARESNVPKGIESAPPRFLTRP